MKATWRKVQASELATWKPRARKVLLCKSTRGQRFWESQVALLDQRQLEKVAAEQPDPETEVFKMQAAQALGQILARLPPERALAIYWFFFENKRLHQIAREFDWSVEKTNNLLITTLQALHEYVTNESTAIWRIGPNLQDKRWKNLKLRLAHLLKNRFGLDTRTKTKSSSEARLRKLFRVQIIQGR